MIIIILMIIIIVLLIIILIIIYLDFSKGSRWMIRGAYTPSRVQSVPFGRCWYRFLGHFSKVGLSSLVREEIYRSGFVELMVNLAVCLRLFRIVKVGG